MLDNISFLPPFSAPGIGYCTCHFYLDEFTESVFDRYNIHQPKSLTRAVPKRKSEFIAGRYCARLALSDFIQNTDSKNIQIHINHDQSPKWPPGIVGSITHSHCTATAVTASAEQYQSLGLGRENILSTSKWLPIEGQVLHEKDVNCCGAQALDRDLFITLVFSAKESLHKMLYPCTHQFLDFQDVYVKSINSYSLTLTLLKNLNSYWVSGTDFTVLYGVQSNEVVTLASALSR